MAFEDLDEFFDSTLRLPIKKKSYVIPSPPAELGLRVQRLFHLMRKAKKGEQLDEKAVAALQLDDDQERDLYQQLLGDSYEEMVADGIEWEQLKHCGITTLIWVAGSIEAAEQYWNSGGVSPEAPAPNRAARRRVGSGSGSSTRRRASTGSTKRPRVIQGEVVPSSGGTSSSSTGH